MSKPIEVEKFKIKLSNQFEVLSDLPKSKNTQLDIKNEWSFIKRSILEIEVCKIQSRRKKIHLFVNECHQAIKRRKEVKNR